MPRLTEELKKQVIELYSKGFSGPKIADILGIKSRNSHIYQVLHAAGIYPNTIWKETGRPDDQKGPYRFSPNMEKEICQRYVNGASLSELCSIYDCSVPVLIGLFNRNGILRKRKGNVARVFGEDKIKEMVEMWDRGESLAAIGRAIGCDPSTAKRSLIANGIKPERVGFIAGLNEEQIAKILRLYNEGNSQESIGEIFGIDQTVISKALARFRGSFDTRWARGKTHGNWNGGRVVDSGGYVYVSLNPNDALFSMCNSSGYLQEHRLAMARHLGRPLTKKETVHHIDGNKTNNELNNLQLRQGKHGKHQAFRCRSCGSIDIESYDLY